MIFIGDVADFQQELVISQVWAGVVNGNSAVDAALETWRKGAEVTMIIREADIGERVKYWVRPDIINRIKEGSIKALYHSSLAAIREKEADIQTPDGLITIANDWVIAMTGYQPNLSFLRKLGIELSDDDVCKPFYNDETYQTNVEGIHYLFAGYPAFDWPLAGPRRRDAFEGHGCRDRWKPLHLHD